MIVGWVRDRMGRARRKVDEADDQTVGATGCLFDGCCAAGCLFDLFAVAAFGAGVAIVIARAVHSVT